MIFAAMARGEAAIDESKDGKLKPCPFCGGNPKGMVCDGSGRYYDDKRYYDKLDTKIFCGRTMTHMLIKCSKCGVMTKPYLTEKGLFKG